MHSKHLPIKHSILFICTLVYITGCGSSTLNPRSHTRESMDFDNRPDTFGLGSLNYLDITADGATQGSLAQKPWADSYWPFYKKNIASRYTSSAEFRTFDEQIRDANSQQNSALLSPAEKFDLLEGDEKFSLTRESWDSYQHYAQIYGADPRSWSWMGICSGWAPAAISEKAPKNSVLASRPDGKQILFFEGDMRALLSKAYDLNDISEGFAFIGSRCEIAENAWIRDSYGRIVDGINTNNGEPFSIIDDHGRSRGILQVKSLSMTSPQETFYFASNLPFEHLGGEQWAFKYTRQEDLALDLKNATLGTHATTTQPYYLRLQKNCRDVNPASLHMAMTQLLAEKSPQKSGFVIEISRGKEVWNHPAWGFRTSISSPRSVQAEPWQKRILRAPQAAYITDVDTEIVYAAGVEPQPIYEPEDLTPFHWNDVSSGKYPVLRLHYDLEFDAAGTIVGGEWKELTQQENNIPDFFWRPNGRPTNANKDRNGLSQLKFSKLQSLLECSQRVPQGTVSIMQNNMPREIPVVRCELP